MNEDLTAHSDWTAQRFAVREPPSYAALMSDLHSMRYPGADQARVRGRWGVARRENGRTEVVWLPDGDVIFSNEDATLDDAMELADELAALVEEEEYSRELVRDVAKRWRREVIPPRARARKRERTFGVGKGIPLEP